MVNETALGSVLVFAVLIATVDGWFKKGFDWCRKTLVGPKVLNGLRVVRGLEWVTRITVAGW